MARTSGAVISTNARLMLMRKGSRRTDRVLLEGKPRSFSSRIPIPQIAARVLFDIYSKTRSNILQEGLSPISGREPFRAVAHGRSESQLRLQRNPVYQVEHGPASRRRHRWQRQKSLGRSSARIIA